MTLLVSSVSARGRALRLGRDVVAALRAGGWEVHVRVTSTASDVEELLGRARTTTLAPSVATAT